MFGKFVYIRAIIKSGRGDLVAKLPWFLNGTTSLSKNLYSIHVVYQANLKLYSKLFKNSFCAFTFLVRIITVTMETADPNILIGSVLSMTLNYVIIGVIIAYTPKEVPVESESNIDKKDAKKVN